MNLQTVESMVTHLVQCSCNGFVDCPKHSGKGLVEGKELPLKQISSSKEIQGEASMKWNNILKDLLARCPQFCRDELILPMPVDTARWRETNSRKVLAPLTLKQNSDNIIAGSLDMSRKRKSDVDSIWIPTKRVKVDKSLKPCSVVIKKTSLEVLLLQHKYVRNSAFVKLYDITKEIPQVKEEEKLFTQNEYMGFLGLDSKEPSCNRQRPEVKTSNPIKLVSHPHIPFSSDYGRRLLLRERCLPQDVALRKIERTEWYLKGAATSARNARDPEITYDKKSKYVHTYKFPKRQFYQNHESLQQAFNKFVCKPLYVELEQTDLSTIMAKIKEPPRAEVEPDVVVINDSDDEDTLSKIEEVAPYMVVINDFDDEDILVSKTVLSDATTKVLSLNCSMPSEDFLSDLNLRPQNNVIVYNEKVEKCTEAPSCEKVRKPRRSLRLNHSKPTLK